MKYLFKRDFRPLLGSFIGIMICASSANAVVFETADDAITYLMGKISVTKIQATELAWSGASSTPQVIPKDLQKDAFPALSNKKIYEVIKTVMSHEYQNGIQFDSRNALEEIYRIYDKYLALQAGDASESKEAWERYKRMREMERQQNAAAEYFIRRAMEGSSNSSSTSLSELKEE